VQLVFEVLAVVRELGRGAAAGESGRRMCAQRVKC
jgi:hypothetical protein